MKNTFSIAFFLISIISLAQQSHTISGTVTDGANGESLAGATIYIVTDETGTVTNEYGFYSITLQERDSISLMITYLGYSTQIKKVYLKQDISLNVKLKEDVEDLEEILITGKKANTKNIEKAQMGVVDIPLKAIKEMPTILGESDVLKVVQLLPGVAAGQEGTTGFFVRGGNNDQNLVLLDGATIYNPNHLFGLFSTFNTRAISKVQLIKGGYPANYGGRLSSILDIGMKEGNMNKTEVQGGIGLISSQITIEGPIKKDTASYIFSARRTYMDLLIRPFLKKNNDMFAYFYDLNGKMNWKISENDRIYFSSFYGRDNAQYTSASSLNYGINFGNSAASLRWNHIFGQKLFLNTTATYNTYFMNLYSQQGAFYSQFYSGINDASGSFDFNYYPNNKHHIKFGGNYIYHTFTPRGKTGSSSPQQNQAIDLNNIPPSYASEAALYFNDEWDITKSISLNYGIRVPYYEGKNAQYLGIWEPRISLKTNLNKKSSIKASYTEMNQFLHLVPSSTASLPSDIWILSNQQTKPELAKQYALGYYRNFKENRIETSVEVYYKTMDNQVLFEEGTELTEQTNLEDQLVYGVGWSYGAEFFLKKDYGKFTGWASYTLSWTNQQFEGLNNGKVFPFRYDRRHNLSITTAYKLNEKWSFSAAFTFYTGSAYTLPVGAVTVGDGADLYGGNFFDYGGKNNYRLRPYHRLDVSAMYKRKRKFFKKEYDSEWVFGIYNVYSRMNPYFAYVEVEQATGKPTAYEFSLIPLIPSVSYNFKF